MTIAGSFLWWNAALSPTLASASGLAVELRSPCDGSSALDGQNRVLRDSIATGVFVPDI